MRAFWRRYRQNRPAVGGLITLVLIVLIAVFGPWVYPVDPFDMVGRPFQLPFGEFPLGTDVSGRDILAGGVAWGTVSQVNYEPLLNHLRR